MLGVSLIGVGTVLRFERGAWSMVKRLRQATNEYAPPPLRLHFLFFVLIAGVVERQGDVPPPVTMYHFFRNFLVVSTKCNSSNSHFDCGTYVLVDFFLSPCVFER